MAAGLSAQGANAMPPKSVRWVQLQWRKPSGRPLGGGEATRDPEPTEVDPNDPKGKQQAIHKAESFAEYLAKRKAA